MATKRSNRIDNTAPVDDTWAPASNATPSEALMALVIGCLWAAGYRGGL